MPAVPLDTQQVSGFTIGVSRKYLVMKPNNKVSEYILEVEAV